MNYTLLNQQLRELSRDIDYDITILSNASALIYDTLDRLNWCGFYLFRDGCLKLGPFQGKPACTKIAPGNGVCGMALKKDRTTVVPNVHEFPGHIACDSASKSEIVIPIHLNGQIYGILDIDSPQFDRFDAENVRGLEAIVQTLEEILTTTFHIIIQ